MSKLFTILVLLFALPVLGQNHHVGLKGGVNWTNVRAKNSFENTKYKIGYTAGLSYQYQLKNNYHFGLDFIYAQKGFDDIIVFTDDFGNSTGTKYTSEFDYNYFSIPLKAGFSVGNKLSSFMNIGIVPSWLTSAVYRSPANKSSWEGVVLDVTDEVTKFDLGGLVEIGGSYTLFDQYIMYTTFGYQHSFTSFTNENYFNNTEVRHYGFGFSIGLKYVFD
ncbi:outer membrane beta-barrel protein [Brumimicrobium aurantiacum]|nr:outer membrane beta-barrel protein [Brumimicrobium aurantiacum]